MGIIKAFTGSLSSTITDQWKEIIVPLPFDEFSIIVPGVIKSKKLKKGQNQNPTDGVITNGSIIFVPENTAAVIFNQTGIEEVITTTGGYEYTKGEKSVLNKDGFRKSINKQVKSRFTFGGISPNEARVSYVNLREIRDIKFGTKGPLIYNDIYYGCDFEIHAHGSFTVKVTNPEEVIMSFVPANTKQFSMSSEKAQSQIKSDFIQSFNSAISKLSKEYRISQLPAESNKLSNQITKDPLNAGSWNERFGIEIVKVSIEHIEYSEKSMKLVDKYNERIMNMKPYKDITSETSDKIIKHGIADEIKSDKNGLFKFLTGRRLLKGQNKKSKTIKNQSKELKRLKSLLDKGMISEKEYDVKKKRILDIQ